LVQLAIDRSNAMIHTDSPLRRSCGNCFPLLAI
jgi:hypothetical protein